MVDGQVWPGVHQVQSVLMWSNGLRGDTCGVVPHVANSRWTHGLVATQPLLQGVGIICLLRPDLAPLALDDGILCRGAAGRSALQHVYQGQHLCIVFTRHCSQKSFHRVGNIPALFCLFHEHKEGAYSDTPSYGW